MDDRELLELIASQVGTLTSEMQDVKSEMQDVKSEMQKGFKKVNFDIQELKEGFKKVNFDIQELKEGQERIENKLDDLEAQNAERHVIINGEVRRIKSTLNKVELVTADNWSDIARIKAKRRIK